MSTEAPSFSMRLDPESLRRVRLWIAKADDDLRVAEILRSDADAPAAAIGFHLQQAMEKSLKAFLVACRRFPGKVHDLALLVDRAASLDGDFARFVDEVEAWTEFAVEERYPSDWAEGTPADFDSGTALARALRDLADRKIQGDLPEPV